MFAKGTKIFCHGQLNFTKQKRVWHCFSVTSVYIFCPFWELPLSWFGVSYSMCSLGLFTSYVFLALQSYHMTTPSIPSHSIEQKYLRFVSYFGTWIKLNQVVLFIPTSEQILFMSNLVKYSWIIWHLGQNMINFDHFYSIEYNFKLNGWKYKWILLLDRFLYIMNN